MRRAFTPGLKLAITLKYLATGINFKILMQGFRVSSNNIGLIVREVCGAIVEEYRDEVINCPKTEEEWKEVAGNFATRWNLCYAHGGLYRKHVRIKKPPKSGSTYYNYNGFFSIIIIMALVDPAYKFMWVEVGANGACSDL